MFYCDACAKKHKKGMRMLKSYGPCEYCHKYTMCNDSGNYNSKEEKRWKSAQ